MAEWCMAHPWMIFCLAVLGLVVIEEAVANACNTVNNIIRFQAYKAALNAEKEQEGDDNNG